MEEGLMKDILENAHFIAIMISAAVSCVALWFIRAQMKSGNDQLGILSNQLRAMHDANQVLHQQMTADHDRAAKELAINLMLTWEKRLQFDTRQVSRLVHRLNEEQCQKLDNLQEFHVSGDLEELVSMCFPPDLQPLIKDVKGILIAGRQLRYLRYTAVAYLNLIESILSAWHQNIVDRKVIEDQFMFLYLEGENALETFRQIGGEDYYPSTMTFLLRLKQIKQE